jgi:hypothetical protein
MKISLGNAFVLVLVLVAAALAACAGGGSTLTTSSATTQSAPIACPSVLPANALVEDIPAPSSTGVNDGQNNVLFIEVPAEVPMAGWGSLTLNGVVQGTLAIAAIPSPLPSGEAFLSAPIATPLMSQTTYSVGVTYTNGCGSPASLTLGTFTTQ